MRAAIYQPRYFPQLHYFNRMLDSDIFVFADATQFTRSLIHKRPHGNKTYPSYQSTTPIKIQTGEYHLTIPIYHAGFNPIHLTKIDYSQNWVYKHLTTLMSAYKKSPHMQELIHNLHILLQSRYENLSDLTIKTTLWALSLVLQLPLTLNEITLENMNSHLQKLDNVRLKKIYVLSSLNIQRPEGKQKGTEMSVAICKKLQADEYFHGATAQNNYMDESYYRENGIRPIEQKWQCREYPQQFMHKFPFIPNISIIDLLSNVSLSEALDILN